MPYFTGVFAGAPERTRISDLPLRRRTLYPTELRAHVFFIQFSVALMTSYEQATFGIGPIGVKARPSAPEADALSN